MSERGRSLSMFVVQRTFTRVRRGYDPEEVDRHLELVSRWFLSTDAGKAIAEERARLKEREAEAEHLVEGARIEAAATLEGARRRAEADTREAERRLAEARDALDAARIEAAAADRIREAQEQADQIVADAQEQADQIVADARAEAERELETARRAGEQLLVHHPSRTVIAKLSTWPTRWDDRLSALADAANVAVLEHLAAPEKV